MAATQTPTAGELKEMALNYFWPHSQQVADFEKEERAPRDGRRGGVLGGGHGGQEVHRCAFRGCG